MGRIDRIARIVIAIGVGILYAANLISCTVAIILFVLACIFIITSMSFCPLYGRLKFPPKGIR